MRDLFEAVNRGFISFDFMKEQVEKGCVRPSLIYQSASRLKDSGWLAVRARLLDWGFVPPFRSAGSSGSRSRTGFLKPWTAGIRRWYEKKALLKLRYRMGRRRF
jgi:hypothetical protein